MSGADLALDERYKKSLLDNTYQKLNGLSLEQDEILRQSLRCVEHSLFRAAYILSWISLIDVIENKLSNDNFEKLNSVREWNITSVEDLREGHTEFHIIEACKEAGMLSRSDYRILIGYMNERHQCAHPSDFFPNFNQTIGYISNILYRIELVQKLDF